MWFGFGGDGAEPFLGDNEGDEDVRVAGHQKFAEVQHGVDVASRWVWHNHQVAGGGCHREWRRNLNIHRDMELTQI